MRIDWISRLVTILNSNSKIIGTLFQLCRYSNGLSIQIAMNTNMSRRVDCSHDPMGDHIII